MQSMTAAQTRIGGRHAAEERGAYEQQEAARAVETPRFPLADRLSIASLMRLAETLDRLGLRIAA